MLTTGELGNVIGEAIPQMELITDGLVVDDLNVRVVDNAGLVLKAHAAVCVVPLTLADRTTTPRSIIAREVPNKTTTNDARFTRADSRATSTVRLRLSSVTLRQRRFRVQKRDRLVDPLPKQPASSHQISHIPRASSVS